MSKDWFRLYHEFATDPKVQSMGEADQRRLIMLFCFQSNETLETLHETDLCFALRITPEELAATKQLFIAKKFIDENWHIMNWGKRQYASDSSTERVRRHREKKCNANETLHNVTETLHETSVTSQKQSRSRAEADSEKKEKLKEKKLSTDTQPTAVTVPKPLATSSPPATTEGLNLNDFSACCACLLALLRWPKLSIPDQNLVAVWCDSYDIRTQVMPVIEAKLNANLLRKGKPINSLNYFAKAVEEKCSGIADEIGRKLRTV